MKRITVFGLSLVVVTFCGCSAWNKDWKKHLPWSSEARIAKSKYDTPTRMVAIWATDVLTTAGQTPTRGVGGRLYFYNERSQPVPVEGQLVVYAYDDKDDIDNSGAPDRKFAFTSDQFSKHFGESDLGASYSIWIPWDAIGGEQQSISLVPVFTSSSGQLVMGQQAIAMLPGRPRHGSQDSDRPTLSRIPPVDSVQPVSHYEANESTPENASVKSSLPSQMRISTIPMSRNLQRYLTQGAPQVEFISEINKRKNLAAGAIPQQGSNANGRNLSGEVRNSLTTQPILPQDQPINQGHLPTAETRDWTRSVSPSARFEPRKHPVQVTPTAPPSFAGPPNSPSPSESLSSQLPTSIPNLDSQNRAASGAVSGIQR